MTTAKPQSLSLYFDAATATAQGLPPVYRNDVGYAVLATHPTFIGKGKDASVPLLSQFTGRVNFDAAEEFDYILAANGALTKSGKSYCRVHGIGQSHAELVAYTIHTSQPKIYAGYTPPSRARALAGT